MLMTDSTQTATNVFDSLNSGASMKKDTELKEVNKKLKALHDLTLEVEHKVTMTEKRLEMVIREIQESREHARQIHLQQQDVNDRLLQGLERIECWMLSKISTLSTPGTNGLVTRENLIDESTHTA